MLFISTLMAVWPMILFIVVLFASLSMVALKLRIPALECELPPKPVFRVLIVLWFIFICILMTLIDSPYIDALKGIESMLFMVSAFFGLPLSMPIFTVAIYAFICGMHKKRVLFSSACLLGLGSFGLGLAFSNVHDVVWCGCITDGYSHAHKAGGDLAAFAWLGERFGLPDDRLYDYATLGPGAFIMVLGELLMAFAAFLRLKWNYESTEASSASPDA
jgi:hypothetical protein